MALRAGLEVWLGCKSFTIRNLANFITIRRPGQITRLLKLFLPVLNYSKKDNAAYRSCLCSTSVHVVTFEGQSGKVGINAWALALLVSDCKAIARASNRGTRSVDSHVFFLHTTILKQWADTGNLSAGHEFGHDRDTAGNSEAVCTRQQ